MAMAPVMSCMTSPFPTPRPRRIVLVDDEPLILQTWKQILETVGYSVLCYADPGEALAAIADGCDCVITDYHMPQMNGLELVEAAKRLTSTQYILMTGNQTPELQQAAALAGVRVLNKPTPIPQVLALLDGICGATAA